MLAQSPKTEECSKSMANYLAAKREGTSKQSSNKNLVHLTRMLFQTPNIHHLHLTACALQIISVEDGWSLLLTKRIKTCTRSVMSEECFSDLAVIAMHSPEKLEVDKMYEACVNAHPRRLFQATLFDYELCKETTNNYCWSCPYCHALTTLFKSEEYCKCHSREENRKQFFGGEWGMALDTLNSNRNRGTGLPLAFHTTDV